MSILYIGAFETFVKLWFDESLRILYNRIMMLSAFDLNISAVLRSKNSLIKILAKTFINNKM